MKKFFLIIALTLVVASKELCAMWPSFVSFTNETNKKLEVVLRRTDIFQEWGNPDKVDRLDIIRVLTLPSGQKKVLDPYSLTPEGEGIKLALASEYFMNPQNIIFSPEQKIESIIIRQLNRLVKKITEDQAKKGVTITESDLAHLDNGK